MKGILSVENGQILKFSFKKKKKDTKKYGNGKILGYKENFVIIIVVVVLLLHWTGKIIE